MKLPPPNKTQEHRDWGAFIGAMILTFWGLLLFIMIVAKKT